MIITSPRGESLHNEELSVSQVEREVYYCIKSEQQSSSNPSQNQKEVLADGSKELSSSLIVGHSREAIVDIDTSATKLSSGGRSNYCMGIVVLTQEKQHNNKPSWGCVRDNNMLMQIILIHHH